jgi:DnaK suppressor protein
VAIDYEKLRSRLEEERSRLNRELDQIRAQTRPVEERREGSPFGKREEEASEALELEKRLAMEQRLNENLSAVEHALQKFEDGTYGLCDICGQAIAPERMEALPHATVCMTCKAQGKDARGK